MSPDLSPTTAFAGLFLCLLLVPFTAVSKSTIEPCAGSDACTAMVGYTLYAPLKVAEVATLFNVDSVALLAANSFDVAGPGDLDHHILPAGLFLKVPLPCPCQTGIRRASARYRTRPADSLSFVADSVFAGLVSPDQIADANSIADPSAPLDSGISLTIPLPCTCFNSSDDSLPAVFLSYVVTPADSLSGIAARYFTTVTDVMSVNAMGSMAVRPGDILSIPIPACPSSFPRYSSDFGLIVPNGSYAIAASHCVQCSCGPGNFNLYCTPSSLSASCSSMQCRNSNLILGNMTMQQSTAGCSVTTCEYGGYVNGTIVTTLSTSLQPRCPAYHQVPPVIPPPDALSDISFLSPAPSPFVSGGPLSSPTTRGPTSANFPGSPGSGPPGSSSNANLVAKPLQLISSLLIFFCLVNALML